MSSSLTLPDDPRQRRLFVILAILAVVGCVSIGVKVGDWTTDILTSFGIAHFEAPARKPAIPISIAPGPPLDDSLEFELDDSNSLRLSGINDPENERFADLVGNYYTHEFVSGFSYEDTSESAPVVRVRIVPEASTLIGRIEARGLKPNFAYQIKLLGDYEHSEAFLALGKVGRWRMPGRETNYTDQDFIDYPNKEEVEAYIFFDYFITDENGDAIREFELDATLHVLWNGSRQRTSEAIPLSHTRLHSVIATNPNVYSRPKAEVEQQYIWAERERVRYESPDEKIHLPPGEYNCFMILTEESWHDAYSNDSGWWATVYKEPISFTITE